MSTLAGKTIRHLRHVNREKSRYTGPVITDADINEALLSMKLRGDVAQNFIRRTHSIIKAKEGLRLNCTAIFHGLQLKHIANLREVQNLERGLKTLIKETFMDTAGIGQVLSLCIEPSRSVKSMIWAVREDRSSGFGNILAFLAFVWQPSKRMGEVALLATTGSQ